MTRPEPVFSDSTIAVLQPAASQTLERSRAVSARRWAVAALLLLLPLLTYWPATFQQYGLRDDYSNLHEAHDEPGKVLQFCASHARPIYGWLLQESYGSSNSVHDLQWMRLTSALLLGVIALTMFRGLKALNWSFNSRLCFCILLVLVPSAQVIAGWAIGWPYAVTALLALVAFFTAEDAMSLHRQTLRSRIALQWLTALILLALCVLIYQPSALFYVVPFAAAVIAQRHRSVAQTIRWTALHLGLVITAMGLAYACVSAMYAAGVFIKSGRIAFEQHWGEKALWYVTETLPNALSLLILNDNNYRDHALYLACTSVVAALLVLGAAVEWQRHGRARGLLWMGALIGLPIFACAVSLVASERYATYRTIFAMTAVLLCFLVASVDALTIRWRPALRRLVAGGTIVVALGMAHHHAFSLIAATQGHEWQLILSGAKRVHLGERPQRVYAIISSPADISTGTIYHDEFGSLSTNSEWVPKEMFNRAMHDLHPNVPSLESRYDFSEGVKAPAEAAFDVIIDMHRLRQFYKSY